MGSVSSMFITAFPPGFCMVEVIILGIIVFAIISARSAWGGYQRDTADCPVVFPVTFGTHGHVGGASTLWPVDKVAFCANLVWPSVGFVTTDVLSN